MSTPANPPGAAIDPAEFLSEHLDGCRTGGRNSGASRRENGKRPAIEHAINHIRTSGDFDRDAASKIARYLGVSARYVRMVAAQTEPKEKRN